jgi:glycosyltransferase involved in cell wall biosynthesis
MDNNPPPPCIFESGEIDTGSVEIYTPDAKNSTVREAILYYIRLFFKLRNRYDQVLIQGLPAGIYWMIPLWKILGKKVFIRLTGININDPATIRKNPWGFLKSIVLRLADRFINPSLALEKAYRRSGMPSSKSVRIPNGVDTLRFHPLSSSEKAKLRKELGFSLKERIVLYVGSIRRAKGIDLLLEAWDRVLVEVPQALLVVAGPLCPICQRSRTHDKDFIDQIKPKLGFFVKDKEILILEEKGCPTW